MHNSLLVVSSFFSGKMILPGVKFFLSRFEFLNKIQYIYLKEILLERGQEEDVSSTDVPPSLGCLAQVCFVLSRGQGENLYLLCLQAYNQH